MTDEQQYTIALRLLDQLRELIWRNTPPPDGEPDIYVKLVQAYAERDAALREVERLKPIVKGLADMDSPGMHAPWPFSSFIKSAHTALTVPPEGRE